MTTARELSLFDVTLRSVSVSNLLTAVCTSDGELFTCGRGIASGHGDERPVEARVPKPIEKLADHKIVGVSVGDCHTASWTKEGQLYTFGQGWQGRLGHGDEFDETWPRLVKGLLGEKVDGASVVSDNYTAVWNDKDELFTSGSDTHGVLGRKYDYQSMSVPVVSQYESSSFLGRMWSVHR